ncbi:MAG: hypothetical protein ACRDD7_03700 [Peptostreptococcaceae bacterium]
METIEVFVDGLKVQLKELAAKECKNIPNKDEYTEGFAMGYTTAIGNVISKCNAILRESRG